MKQFWKILKRYASPYRGYLGGAVGLNILSAVFNIFSFSLIIPILNMLFKLDDKVYTFIPWDADAGIKEKALNNAYYYVLIISAERVAK